MDYTIRAVVDWLDVGIQTSQPTNQQTVRRAFGAALACKPPYVRAVGGNTGGGTQSFVVRVHDVERYALIPALVASASAAFRGNQIVGWGIEAIEVAVDCFCHNPAEQAANYFKFMKNPVSNNRRMYRDFKGSGKALPRQFESIQRQLEEGWQIGIGNKTDDRFQHIYMKESDTIDGQRQQVENRARFEIRLRGSGLPCQSHDGWQQCKFEQLSNYFRLQELKSDLDPYAQFLADAANQIGERRVRNRREGGIRLHNKATQASPINEAIRDALRKLSARWKRSGRQGKGTIPDTIACGFSRV